MCIKLHWEVYLDLEMLSKVLLYLSFSNSEAEVCMLWNKITTKIIYTCLKLSQTL